MMTMVRREILAGILAFAGSGLAGRAASPPHDLDAAGDLLSVDYAARDFEIVDYGFYADPRVPRIRFRGPPFDPSSTREFFTCIGAAQTLGVYVERPWPAILSRQLGMPAWNVGVGGAGPGFFLSQPELLNLANRGRFVILQVMAARSESNARFRSLLSTELVRDTKRGDVVNSATAWKRVSSEEPETLFRYIDESRRSWVDHMARLLSVLTVPTILFWFSPKSEIAAVDYRRREVGLADSYPQLVDAAVVTRVKKRAEHFVACHSARNRGHPLLSRFTGQPVEVDYAKLGKFGIPLKESRNLYYPSPEMHEDAASALFPVVSRLISRQTLLQDDRHRSL